MSSTEFHAFRKALKGILDPGSKVGSRILGGSGNELESKVEDVKFASGELCAGKVWCRGPWKVGEAKEDSSRSS